MESSGWWQQAACAGVPTEVFYRAGYTRDHLAEAEAVCNGCPVLGPCLAEELAGSRMTDEWSWEQHGFRGGLSASQRRRIVDQRLTSTEIEWIENSTADPRQVLIVMSRETKHQRGGIRQYVCPSTAQPD